jgi:hypothetical protein
MRLFNWESNLSTAMESVLSRKFEWGLNDCVSFACLCVLSVTGKDLYAPYRGQYCSEAQANALVSRLGGLEQAADLHFTRVTKAGASVGDLGISLEGALCIHSAPGRFVSLGPRGLVTVQESSIKTVWGVV